MRNMTITVVIPFYNAGSTLPSCLSSIECQILAPQQVILVDNNSTDTSVHTATQFTEVSPHQFIFLKESQQGPSYARNRGAKEAKGEIIAFTDADCTADPNWLIQIANAFADPRIAAVAGRIFGLEAASVFDKFHRLFTMRGSAEPHIFREFTLTRGGFPTANLAVRRHVFDQIGGFDETMRIYSEDYDFCARIYQAGYAISYSPDAVIYHKHRNTLIGTWKQSFGFGNGHAVLLKKHFERMLIVDLPGFHYLSRSFRLRAWLDFKGADKKAIALALLSWIWWPFTMGIAFYLLYLFADMGKRAKEDGCELGLLEKCALVLLLLYKSAAITCGRLVGAFRNKVLCF